MNIINDERDIKILDGIKSANMPNDHKEISKIYQNEDKVTKFIMEYFCNKENKISDVKSFSKELIENYTKYYLFDIKLSFNDVRFNLEKFNNNLEKIVFDIENIEGIVFNSIYDFELSHRELIEDLVKNNIGDVVHFRNYCIQMKSIIDRILRVRSKKIPRIRVYKACIDIINFYEEKMGRKFVYNLVTPTGRKVKDRVNRKFKNIDAQFVHDLMVCLDPKLTFEMILTGLKRALAERRERSE